MSKSLPSSSHRCLLCGSRTFIQFTKRAEVLRCAKCRSLPRTRMLGLALMHAPPPARLPVVHFAPETGLAHFLRARYGDHWTPTDIDPSRYEGKFPGTPVLYADLCRPSDYFEGTSVHGIIHSHVLEHVAADINLVLSEMNAAIAPGGFHAFVVPIRTETYEEDLDMSKSDDYRLRRFGHVGHVRNFGRLDFESVVLSHFRNWHRVDLPSLVSPSEFASAAMPRRDTMSSFTGSTAFLFIKPY